MLSENASKEELAKFLCNLQQSLGGSRSTSTASGGETARVAVVASAPISHPSAQDVDVSAKQEALVPQKHHEKERRDFRMLSQDMSDQQQLHRNRENSWATASSDTSSTLQVGDGHVSAALASPKTKITSTATVAFAPDPSFSHNAVTSTNNHASTGNLSSQHSQPMAVPFQLETTGTLLSHGANQINAAAAAPGHTPRGTFDVMGMQALTHSHQDATSASPSDTPKSGFSSSHEASVSSSSSVPSFPMKLYGMLHDAQKYGFEPIVGWQSPILSSGIAFSFKVRDTHRFAQEIMPQYFNQTKFKSFQRQLNIYGFQRIHDGPNRGGYFHKNFIRGAPERLKLIPRNRPSEQQAQQAAKKQQQQPHATDPNSALIAALASLASAQASSELSSVIPTSSAMLLEALTGVKAAGTSPNNNGNAAAAAPHDQLMALLAVARDEETIRRIMLLNATRNLSSSGIAANFSAVAAALGNNFSQSERTAEVPAPSTVTSSNTDGINQHVFPWKLYKMLEEAPSKNFAHIVSWVNDKSFKVHNTTAFVAEVMYQYFDQTKYESFRRQLNLYGFSRIVRGQHRGVYSHHYFVRGRKDLCRFIVRQQFSQVQNNHENDSGVAHARSNEAGEDGTNPTDTTVPPSPSSLPRVSLTEISKATQLPFESTSTVRAHAPSSNNGDGVYPIIAAPGPAAMVTEHMSVSASNSTSV